MITFLMIDMVDFGLAKLISAMPGMANRCRVIECGRANSRRPSAPWMRPNPESPTPPNGNAEIQAKPSTEFTEVAPARMRRAISMPLRREKTVEASP